MDLLERNATDQKSWSGFSQRNAPLVGHILLNHNTLSRLTYKPQENLYLLHTSIPCQFFFEQFFAVLITTECNDNINTYASLNRLYCWNHNVCGLSVSWGFRFEQNTACSFGPKNISWQIPASEQVFLGQHCLKIIWYRTFRGITSTALSSILSLILWSHFFPRINVTLHLVSGNKVNACTLHVMTRSHANGMTRLLCRYVHKNNLFWKACSKPLSISG